EAASSIGAGGGRRSRHRSVFDDFVGMRGFVLRQFLQDLGAGFAGIGGAIDAVEGSVAFAAAELVKQALGFGLCEFGLDLGAGGAVIGLAVDAVERRLVVAVVVERGGVGAGGGEQAGGKDKRGRKGFHDEASMGQ